MLISLKTLKQQLRMKILKRPTNYFCPLAEGSNAEAQTILGTLYINGQGVEKDVTKGLSLIMKAGTQGYEAARSACAQFVFGTGKTGRCDGNI